MAYPVFLFMAENEQKVKIKGLQKSDRPREKLLAYGRRHLSDAELMAVLIGSGSIMENAVDLGQRILGSYGHDLYNAGNASVKELCAFSGIGEAKALAIIAALELGRRRKNCPQPKATKITSSKNIYELMLPVFADLHHEEFWVVILNKANTVTGRFMISKGGMSGTVADPKVIFKTALEQNAAYLILAHNHPSGNLNPSAEDISITKRLAEAGKLLDLPVLDHLIITNQGYFSLADEGII